MPSAFLITILGTLLAVENMHKVRLFSRSQDVSVFITQGVRLVWQTVALLIINFLWRLLLPNLIAFDWAILVLIPAAYALGMLEKEAIHFRICSFVAAYFSIEQGMGDLIIELCFGVSLALAVTLIQILIIGVHERLITSRIPLKLKDLPIIFVIASIVLLSFWAVQGSGEIGGILS